MNVRDMTEDELRGLIADTVGKAMKPMATRVARLCTDFETLLNEEKRRGQVVALIAKDHGLADERLGHVRGTRAKKKAS